MFDEYMNLFSGAVSRTAEHGFGMNEYGRLKLKPSKKKYSSPENKEGLLKHFFRCLGNVKAEDINSRSAIELLIIFKPYLEDYLDVSTMITIGGLDYKGIKTIQFGEKEIEALHYKIIPEYRSVNVHVWLTLPTTEIIDISYLEIVNNQRGLPFKSQAEFEYIFDKIDNIYMNEHFTYKPMLVGVDSLNKLNLIKYKDQLI
ncbi:MAG: hypothetical protein ABIP51_01025 [Bacteroidia bacterium]